MFRRTPARLFLGDPTARFANFSVSFASPQPFPSWSNRLPATDWKKNQILTRKLLSSNTLNAFSATLVPLPVGRPRCQIKFSLRLFRLFSTPAPADQPSRSEPPRSVYYKLQSPCHLFKFALRQSSFRVDRPVCTSKRAMRASCYLLLAVCHVPANAI